MPKTKNAFAFRDFDSARILQRPFFKSFYFDTDKLDTEILQSLSTTEDSVDSSEKKLYMIQIFVVLILSWKSIDFQPEILPAMKFAFENFLNCKNVIFYTGWIIGWRL